MATKKPKTQLTVEALKHPVEEATRTNIPTAEHQAVLGDRDLSPVRVAMKRRNRDLDPQLVWRGKDEADACDLVVNAAPLYIQEKVSPKVLIDDLLAQQRKVPEAQSSMFEMFSDFNGYPKDADKTAYYQYDGKWQNRMILGDSLQVMASLAEREGLRGKVQCIYFDPPYGIKFNSNFQWSTTSRDVKDGNSGHITREPEQVKAFRDTWKDGIHSYLSYVRDRAEVFRLLLGERGSIFVQIGDENAHRVRNVLDEVFGEENHITMISFNKTGLQASRFLSSTHDHILWYAKDISQVKFRRLFRKKVAGEAGATGYTYIEEPSGSIRALTKDERDSGAVPEGGRVLDGTPMVSAGSSADQSPIVWRGEQFKLPPNTHWKTTRTGLNRLARAGRILKMGKRIEYKMYLDDFGQTPIDNFWASSGERGFTGQKTYVVQTAADVIERCILMGSDPGDLVLDPTCGSGTTAYVAEEWGRRWITIDTSRVALALARARIMGAKYPYYLLTDSREGQVKEAEITRRAQSSSATKGDLTHGFVCDRAPHVMLSSVANNTEIDLIYDAHQQALEPLRSALNETLKKKWEEWEIPREPNDGWPTAAKKLHAAWWAGQFVRQHEIDKSIAASADVEYLYDKPYKDPKKVRVAGPFTVESLTPHRSLAVDENGAVLKAPSLAQSTGTAGVERNFTGIILENLLAAGVQQAHKVDKLTFSEIKPWPGGGLVCAEGRYVEGSGDDAKPKRAAIFVGPEFGTVHRVDLAAAAREAAEAGFDLLVGCGFNFDAHSTDLQNVGKVRVLKARMNADLHMAEDLKKTDKANLFVVFGEPDIDVRDAGNGQLVVQIKGVDVFSPTTGDVRSSEPDQIACWFIDTNYNEESFFVRHAYFLGASDPYKNLRSTLKGEINEEAWASLKSDTSRPFGRPESGRIAVKVINHLGDEVMKVFRVTEKTVKA